MTESLRSARGGRAPEELEFKSHGVTCRGDLHRPSSGDGDRPAVVMGHGFGATRACGLAPFADALVAAGYVVFAFDCRGFGTSDGEPRRVVDPARQVEDFLAAAAFVRSLPGVAADRVAFWGTSFGGGVATVAASRDQHVRAVVAQCPMMDGRAATMRAIRNGRVVQLMRLNARALVDVVAWATRQRPRRIASAGPPGSVAAMTADDCADGYAALVPPGVETDVAARIVVTLPFFRPVAAADRVRCPVLVQICERDTVAPASAAERAAERMPLGSVRHYDCGHFDIYQGAFRDRSIRDQLAFLDSHLTDRPDDPA